MSNTTKNVALCPISEQKKFFLPNTSKKPKRSAWFSGVPVGHNTLENKSIAFMHHHWHTGSQDKPLIEGQYSNLTLSRRSGRANHNETHWTQKFRWCTCVQTISNEQNSLKFNPLFYYIKAAFFLLNHFAEVISAIMCR